MNSFNKILPLLFLTLIVKTSSQQFNPAKDFQKNQNSVISKTASENNYLERGGAWPYGSCKAIGTDDTGNLIFAGSGGAVLVIDAADKNNPVLINDEIRTYGLVEEIFYDDATARLYLACGEGGLDIWDLQTPAQPILLSRTEILYFGVETPVRDVQVQGDLAYVECSFGYVHSVDVSDPQNPVQIAFNGFMGNPSHDIHLGTGGRLHTTGAQYYVRFNIPPDGSLGNAGGKEFFTGAGKVFGMEDIAFVGYAGSMYILDLLISGFPAWSITNVGGISDIEVHNDIAYIVNEDGFQLWDVSNVQSPSFLSSLSEENAYEDVFVKGDYAFIAAGPTGFRIFDVSDSTDIQLMASYDTYSTALDAFIKDDLAYIADGEDGILIVDVANIDYPELIGEYSLNELGAYQVIVQDSILYAACWTNGFRIIDVSDPSNPSQLGIDSSYDMWKLDVNGNYAYVVEAIANSQNYVHIYDISDPVNPVELSSTEFPVTVYEVLYYNGYLFVANEDNGLRILDVSDPENPTEAASLDYPDVFDFDISGNVLFVCAPGIAQPDGGFYSVDISDPTNPIELDMYEDPAFTCFRVKVDAGFAFITDGNDIHLIDVSDPSSMVYLEEYRMPGFCFDLFVKDRIAYVADTEAGLQMINNLQVVPVELVLFNANVSEDFITLNWQTATETNNSGFEIERRIEYQNNLSTWDKIGFVEGSGTSSNYNHYNFIDKNVLVGIHHYRLIQIDFDGTRKVIANTSVDLGLNLTEYSLNQNYPNPFNNSTLINYTIPQSDFVTIKVYNSTGEEINTLVNEFKESGEYSINFDDKNLVSGVYFYRINTPNYTVVRKMLLIK